jgi:hypothetical protein
MLHREAQIAARLANTGMVPRVHDDPAKRRLQAMSKMCQVKFKARKEMGVTRVYGVYDTIEKQKKKEYDENFKRSLADRDGYKLSGELSAHHKKARLSTRKVPRIPDDVGDAPEGLVQKNELSTYEELLRSEWNHSTNCSSARAGRLAKRYEGKVNFNKNKQQIVNWFKSKHRTEKRRREKDAADGAVAAAEEDAITDDDHGMMDAATDENPYTMRWVLGALLRRFIADERKKKMTQGWVVNGVRRHAEPLGDGDPLQLSADEAEQQ